MKQSRMFSLMLVAFRCTFCGRSVHADRTALRPKKGDASANLVDCPHCGGELEPRFAPMGTRWDESLDLADKTTRLKMFLGEAIDPGSSWEAEDEVRECWERALERLSFCDPEAFETRLRTGLSREDAADNLGPSDPGAELCRNWISARQRPEESKREQDVGATVGRARSGRLNRLVFVLVRGIRELFQFRRS